MSQLWTDGDSLSAAKLNKSFNTGLYADRGSPSIVGEAYFAYDGDPDSAGRPVLLLSSDGATWDQQIELKCNKNVAGGYVGLDANTNLPNDTLPSQINSMYWNARYANKNIIAGTWSDDYDVLQVDFDPMLVSDSTQYNLIYNVAGTDQDEIDYESITLNAGTYKVTVTAQKSPTSGILKIYHGSNLISTFDMYSAGNVFNTVDSQTYQPVANTTGAVRLLVDSKNPSASNYFAYLSRIEIVRTA